MISITCVVKKKDYMYICRILKHWRLNRGGNVITNLLLFITIYRTVLQLLIQEDRDRGIGVDDISIQWILFEFNELVALTWRWQKKMIRWLQITKKTPDWWENRAPLRFLNWNRIDSNPETTLKNYTNRNNWSRQKNNDKVYRWMETLYKIFFVFSAIMSSECSSH